jgi:electron transfer flavoprotein alpha subunit
VSVNAWIVVGDQPAIGNLITVARSLGGPVGAVVAGPRSVAETVAASGVDKVVWCGAPDDAPAEALAPAVAETVAADPPRVVLAAATPATGCSWAPPPPGSRRPS